MTVALRRRVPSWIWCRAILFFVIFGLLVIPWPGFSQFYSAYFRAVGTAAFTRTDSMRTVRFESSRQSHGFEATDTRMLLGNLAFVDAQGRGPVIPLDIDTLSVGWMPTALTLALIGATPIPWPRKSLALLAGFVLIQLFVLFSVQTCIWSESSAVRLLDLTPFWQDAADTLRYTFYGQMGIDFTVPVVIWIIVSFRVGDLHSAWAP